MTPEYLVKICSERDGYVTPEHNKILYLHKIGFKKIQNLDR